MANYGKVWLVGAGPGDPELLTLRAARAVAGADVVLHDRLVSPEILALAPACARLEDVGKRAREELHTQAYINQRLIELARSFGTVVRLKGGDPFVFGRGGEEIMALQAAGVPFEIVPGITAALGCAAYAGIPLTHRGLSQSVSLVTAHGETGMPDVDWAGLARANHTVVFYMGVGMLARIQRELLRHGRNPGTAVALVENGTTAQQRFIRTTLNAMVKDAVRTRVGAPSLVVVGEVAGLDLSPTAITAIARTA